jgi:paraquat-inducible protein B
MISMMTSPSDNDAAAEPLIEAPRRSLSPIWLVPLAALLLGLFLVYRHYAELGAAITIRFNTAEGLEANVTRIRYKDVEIGKVTHIELAEDLAGVHVRAQMVKYASPWLTDKTRFWVVRPQIGLGGVSGLDTLFSGAYIQADVVAEGRPTLAFQGLETPPQTAASAPGMRLILRAEQAGSITIGSPVYYRQMPVGQVEARRFAGDDYGVEFEIFIHAPHHTQINHRTRFWNVSGIQGTLSSDGLKFQTGSLESLLAGGIAFANLDGSTGEALAPDTVLRLYTSENAAREQTVAEGISARFAYMLYFRESVRGLKADAPVEYLGVPVGRVVEVSLRYDEHLDEAYIPVLIELEPERMGAPPAADVINDAITRGLRAQLQTGNLVTGQLFVALKVMNNADSVTTLRDRPYPEIPTVPSEFTLLAEKTNAVFDKVLALPLEDLLANATQTVASADTLLRDAKVGILSTQLVQVLTQVQENLRLLEGGLRHFQGIAQKSDATVSAARTALDGVAPDSPLYFELNEALKALQDTARAVKTLTVTLERNPRALILGK